MSNIMSNNYIIYYIEWYIKIFHIFYHLENSEKILIYFQIYIKEIIKENYKNL